MVLDNVYLPKFRPLCKEPPPSADPTDPHRESGLRGLLRSREKRGKRRKRRRARISSSGSAEANCIQGTEAVVADPHSSLSPNWPGHLT